MSARKTSVIRVLSAVALVVAAALYFLPKLRKPAESSAPDRVILISIDTCRPDFLGCYNPDRSDVTPNLDELAKQATRFENVTAPVPITLPSHCSMFTGVVPPGHGVRQQPGLSLRADAATVPMLMEMNGYTTGGFVSASVLDGALGLARGFDVYDDEMPPGPALGWARERLAEDTTKLAMDWVGQHEDERLFLFVHYYDAHLPYKAPAEFAERFDSDDPGQYSAELAYVDHWIGKLLDDLKKREMYDDAMIIITADHGEMLGEHGEHGHQYFIYEPAIRVPMLIKMPGQASPRVVTDPVGLVDLAPTMVSVLQSRQKMFTDGRSLTPYILDGETSLDAERMLYCESVVPFAQGASALFGLSGVKWKYIEATRPELYDLQADPGEMNNVVEQHARMARQFYDEADAIFETGLAKTATQTLLDEQGTPGYVGASSEQLTSAKDRPDPKDLIKYHDGHQKAVLLQSIGQEEEALAICLDLISQKPDFLMAQVMASRMLFQKGRYAESLVHADAIVERDPEKLSERLFRASVHEALGDDDAALKDYDFVIAKDNEIDPSDLAQGIRTRAHPSVYYDRAKLLSRQGDTAAAIDDVKTALSYLSDDSPDRAEGEELLRELKAKPGS